MSICTKFIDFILSYTTYIQFIAFILAWLLKNKTTNYLSSCLGHLFPTWFGQGRYFNVEGSSDIKRCSSSGNRRWTVHRYHTGILDQVCFLILFLNFGPMEDRNCKWDRNIIHISLEFLIEFILYFLKFLKAGNWS